MKSRILPWIGELYRESGVAGKRILVLGESNYDPQSFDEGKDYSRIIVENVKECVFDTKVRFFTKVAKLILSANGTELASRDDIKMLWHQIAFYNLVQHVFQGPRIRPSPEMWEEGKKAFSSVLIELDPNIVIVMGKALGNHLPAIPASTAVVLMAHPSSFGFKYEPWVCKVREALGKRT